MNNNDTKLPKGASLYGAQQEESIWGYWANQKEEDAIATATEPKSEEPPKTLKEGFKRLHNANKPKYGQLGQDRLKEGKCPNCGELGRYHLSTPVCPQHGPY